MKKNASSVIETKDDETVVEEEKEEERICDLYFVGSEDTRNVEIHRVTKIERENVELFLRLSKTKKIDGLVCKTLLMMYGLEVEMLSSAPLPYRSGVIDPSTKKPAYYLWKSTVRYDNYNGDIIVGCDNEDCSEPTKRCEREHPLKCYYLYRIPIEHALKYLDSMMESENAIYAQAFKNYVGFA
jgi:hypothetical protein